MVVTSGGLNKLAVYEGLGVAEVWIYESGAFSVYHLGASGYERAPRSRFFVGLDFEVLATHMAMPDQDDAVRACWDRLR